MIISLPIPHCFGWEGPSCSVCINSVRLRLRPPGRAGLIGEKAWEQIGPEKAHNIHILTNIWDHCWGWKWGTCDWSWPHVAEVSVALELWQEQKSEKQRERKRYEICWANGILSTIPCLLKLANILFGIVLKDSIKSLNKLAKSLKKLDHLSHETVDFSWPQLLWNCCWWEVSNVLRTFDIWTSIFPLKIGNLQLWMKTMGLESAASTRSWWDLTSLEWERDVQKQKVRFIDMYF